MRTACWGLALLAFSVESQAVGHLADVEILNRDTGQILPVYRSGDEYWVAGTPGARYAVLLHNRGGQRVMAVTSVDGVNVISGETAAWDQTGYVFYAGQRYSIDGWRKSNQEVAAFNFTALADAYAARTGRPANVGVIGVALFQEKEAPISRYAPAPREERDEASRLGRLSRERAAAAPQATSPDLESPAYAASLGTGHGARESSYVSNTAFERATRAPAEVIKIRYDRLENLVAMGVVKPRAAPAAPNPFPESGLDRFVPDPPGR